MTRGRKTNDRKDRRVNIRIPQRIRERLEMDAAFDGVSVSEQVRRIVDAHYSKDI